MALELVEDAPADARNARFLGMAADLAYLPPDKGPAEFASKLGLQAQLISVDNTQAYVAQNDDHVVLAFRGTEKPDSLEGLKDWLLTDAVNLLIIPKGRLGTDLAAAGVGAKFHQGFADALGEVWEPVLKTVKSELDRRDRPLWVTGHSLGGALAMLSSWILQRQFVPVHQVYTYGAPMIGNRAASDALNKEFKNKLFRYVNLPDPVPQLPTVSLLANDFIHCDREITLGESTGSAFELFKSAAAKTVDGLLKGTVVDDIWKLVTDRVQAHLMTSYHGLLDKLK